MSELSDCSKYHRLLREFLLTDIDVAMTFLDLAENTRREEVRRRNENNARRAHALIVKLLSKVSSCEMCRQAIEPKLFELKERLTSTTIPGICA